MKRTIFYVIASIIFILIYTAYGAKQRADEVLDKYKQEEIHKIEQNLKNFVDVAYSTIDSNYKNSMDKKYLEKHYGHRLKNIIDVAETILKVKIEEIENGKLNLEEAQAEAATAIQRIRYDNGRGYIWINDTNSKMVMHPLAPSLNGKIMDDPKYNCAMGKEQNLYMAYVEVAQEPGGGFVDYLWPKPTKDGLTTDVPKLSYVRLFPEWDWIIGTDFSVEDAILEGMERSKDELRQMRYDNGIGFFWINNIDESSPMFHMYPIGRSIENIVLAGGHLDKLGSVIKSFIKICKEKGSGYINYTWDKPTLKKPIKNVPKLSYVKLYEPLGWIIGTGVYMDDVDKFIAREKEFLEQRIWRLIINVSLVSIIFVILISVMQYYNVFGRFFSKSSESVRFVEPTVPQKPQQIPTKTAKPQTIDANDYLKTVLDISKIMLAQAELLALTATIQATQGDQKSEMEKEMKQLVEQFHNIIADIQKKIM